MRTPSTWIASEDQGTSRNPAALVAEIRRIDLSCWNPSSAGNAAPESSPWCSKETRLGQASIRECTQRRAGRLPT
jgi:hypothetical protein